MIGIKKIDNYDAYIKLQKEETIYVLEGRLIVWNSEDEK